MLELNKIYNMDCLEGIKLIDDGCVDLIVTDPPYLHDNGNWMKSDVMGTKTILGRGTIYDSEGYLKTKMSQFGVDEIYSFLEIAVSKMKIPNMYLFCSEVQVPIYGMWAREHKLHFTILTWEKPLSIINKNRFSQNTEYVVQIYDFGTGLNRVENNNYYNKVLHTRILRGKEKTHPTQKPIEIMQMFVELSSKKGDLVLDPFIGSGTTGVACVNTNRNFIGFELDEKYFDIAGKRIEEALFNRKTELLLF